VMVVVMVVMVVMVMVMHSALSTQHSAGVA
jgi:hypothetical protein